MQRFLYATTVLISMLCCNVTLAQDVVSYCGEGQIIDCFGKCGGPAKHDICGVCDGTGKTTYATAQAGDVDCCAPGTPKEEGVPNDCGFCGAEANYGKDDCGDCGGPGKSTYTVEGVDTPVQCCPAGSPWYEGEPNVCGICGGTEDEGKDDCGVCFGPGKETFHSKYAGTVEYCPDDGVPDECGDLNGDGSGCCAQFAVGVKRMQGSKRGIKMNTGASVIPACATTWLLDEILGAQFDESEADDDAYKGKIITPGEKEGFVIYDEDCNVVSKNVEDADDGSDTLDDECIAGIVSYDSPISLLVDGSTTLDTEVTLVQFPLHPGNQGHWYEWHASAKAPLLVYDPAHIGKITSAHQLFGNWTFGGKKLASLNGTSLGLTSSAWKDGYEALGTLDHDADGELSGSELAPLGLWYDHNRDGISQDGEVVALQGTEFESLRYSGAEASSDGHLYLENGVTTVNESLTSVDWYGKGAATRFQLVAELAELNRLPSEKSQGTVAEAHSTSELPAMAKAGKHRLIRGLYRWKESTDSQPAQGLLILTENSNGEVSGITASEMKIDAAHSLAKKANSFAVFRRLSGKVVRDEQGATLSFSVSNNSVSTHTEARLTFSDGKLTGTSKLSLNNKEKDLVYKYDWSSTKLR